MSRRTKTLAIALGALFLLVIVGSKVQVPLVALGPGPTFNTLGSVRGQSVVTVTGRPAYPTSGHLEMTTVGVTDQLMAFQAMRAWLDPNEQVVPRAAIYPPGQSDAQVMQENTQLFSDSENNARVAALRYLHEPLKVLVDSVSPKTPADGQLRLGDQILAVNGQPIGSAAQVSALLRQTKPGDAATVGFQRAGGPPATVTVALGVRPSLVAGGPPDGPQGFLGVTPVDAPLDPNQIKISLDDVGGPSAGLMFTLGVLDKITPDDLTGGKFIAGTGTIDGDGNVGPISGIPLKMIAARAAGATAFLAPAGDCEEAKGAVPEGLTLVKVNTLTEAVDSLHALKAGRPVPGC